ncbi:M4 family metallopeptidase [Flavobacterium sp. N1994]|uniref:M4 family metallopeptidase n=1 Tax=Flavobacterium sp. N1994 TaxID=2986827 RepID=UPI002221F14D|nr:M4 family metallopeptidase [Flavobacterium sp. N1994]
MIKNSQNYLRLIVLVSLFTFSSYAQEGDKNVKQKIMDEKGNISLITFNEKSSYKSGDFNQVFKDQLKLKNNSSFQKTSTETDQKGYVHEKFQLFHKGVKVEFASYTLHSKNGSLVSMSGETYPLENINTIPTLSTQQAFTKALNQIDAKSYLWDNPTEAAAFSYTKPDGELVLLPVSNNDIVTLRLAYKFDIYATNPVSRGDLYIDAVTGNALFYNATIKHLGEYSNGGSKSNEENILTKTNSMLVAANADTRYSGTQSIQTTLSGSSYILADATRGLGINTYNMKKGTSYTAAVNFTDADNNWTSVEYANTNKDNGALDAHWGAEKTYDYWSTVHGRNSYNNAGAAIKSYVHYSTAYDNAYWNGSVMTYGDGSGTYFDILTSIDVAGHEIGHAVCTNTANLAYQKESGAMNEAFSDIWGACIEYFAAPNKQRWLIGEDIERRAGHLSLRSMSNPKTELQPDTYGGTYWKTVSCTPTSTNDYCGVHTNSGVLNHWFYILTEGKTGTNDIGSSYSVTGIGIDKAAKIAFRTESVYLTANSTYANARTYGIQAATDLYGANSAEVIATTNAFYAVGIGTAYAGPADTIAPTAPTTLAASGTTTTTTSLSWSASTDNVAVTGYNVYQGTTLLGTSTTTSYNVTGLTGATTYSFSVKAKDAAGNLSPSSNVVNVTTLTPVPDTTAPTAATLSATGTTTTSTNLSWTGATDNVGVTGYDVYQGTTLKASVTSTSYAVTGLTASITYTFYVIAKDAAGNVSPTSNTVSVTTSATTLTYCTATSTNTVDEKIGKVVFGTISNTSTGTAGYENFTSLSTNAVRGTANSITITPAWASTVYPEGYAVFIDYNQNGLFTDAGETVWIKAASTTTPVIGTFTIPTTATLGSTRMRVVMKYNATPTACGSFTYGQVEDYTVNITLTAAGLIDETLTNSSAETLDFNLYPNPTESRLNVSLTDENATYEIINFLGQAIKKGKLSQEGIDVSELNSGVYFLKVSSKQQSVSKKFIKK